MTDTKCKMCSACNQSKPTAEFHKNARTKDGLRSSCKSCTKLINAASVSRHREKRLAEKRADYLKRRESPEFIARLRNYTQQIAERKKIYDKQYRERTREKQRARSRNWVKQNPEKRSAISRNYKSKRRAWTENGVSTAELLQWTKQQPKVCHWCEVECEVSFHVDHYLPLSKGGEHELYNLVIACESCNLRKNAKHPDEFLAEIGKAA